MVCMSRYYDDDDDDEMMYKWCDTPDEEVNRLTLYSHILVYSFWNLGNNCQFI